MLGTSFWPSWTSGWAASSFLLLSALPTADATGFFLAAQDHRTDAQRFRGAQIGNGELRLEGAHLAG